jgi:lipoprotein-anchoring transpeptidase ErfK/SrfK
VRPAFVTTIVALVLGALAGGAPAEAASAIPGAPTVRAAWVAHIVTPTPAWSAPARGHRRTAISPIAESGDAPVALLVLGARRRHNGTTWLRVLLPQRPNGSSVWIDADLVRLTRTPWRIEVSLEQRTVSLLRGGRVTNRWPAVVGKPSTPTPTGLFSVYQRVRQPNPNAFLGTWALLLSGFSNALREFDGGPGRFAIHGRGGTSLLDPLGTARSHGCIRIDNGAVDVLAADAAEGTPVQIT